MMAFNSTYFYLIVCYARAYETISIVYAQYNFYIYYLSDISKRLHVFENKLLPKLRRKLSSYFTPEERRFWPKSWYLCHQPA